MSSAYTVFGGTGFLGRQVVAHLLASGQKVRVAARHPDRLVSGRLETIRADILEPASLHGPLREAAGVVNAVGLYVEGGSITFDAVHVEAAGHLAALACRADVPRFVQLSGIGADPDARDPYIRARGRGERAVTAALPGAVVVRPSAMFGAGGGLVPAILGLARKLPFYPLFGRGLTRLQPVCVNDVGQAIARLLQSEYPADLYEFGGPEAFRYRDLVLRVTGAAGAKVRPVPVPYAAWHALAAVAERLPGAPLTRSQVALMRRDNVASADVPGLAALGVSPRRIEQFVQSQSAT